MSTTQLVYNCRKGFYICRNIFSKIQTLFLDYTGGNEEEEMKRMAGRKEKEREKEKERTRERRKEMKKRKKKKSSII